MPAILKPRRSKRWRRRIRTSQLSLPTPRSCMYPRTIRGWFTGIQSWRGRDGIRILEFGLVARISHSESASQSGGSEVLVGDGVVGDSTGITTTQGLTTAGITPRAEPCTDP